MNYLVETIGRSEGMLRAAVAECTRREQCGKEGKERLHRAVSVLEDEQKLRP